MEIVKDEPNKLLWCLICLFFCLEFICEISTVLGSELLAKNKGIVHLFQMGLTFFPQVQKIYFVSHWGSKSIGNLKKKRKRKKKQVWKDVDE